MTKRRVFGTIRGSPLSLAIAADDAHLTGHVAAAVLQETDESSAGHHGPP